MAKPRFIAFVSYAHADRAIVRRFLETLRPRCATLLDAEIELWADERLVVGESWEAEIERAVQEADLGLLCVSPSFLASPFVTQRELPALLAADRFAIPIALEPLALDRLDLKGLAPLQIFFLRPPHSRRPLAFDECRGVSAKRFCDALVGEIVERLRRGGRLP